MGEHSQKESVSPFSAVSISPKRDIFDTQRTFIFIDYKRKMDVVQVR